MSAPISDGPREDSQAVVLVVGLLMLFLGGWAVAMAAVVWWGVALALTIVLGCAAWFLRPAPSARALRFILAGLAAMSLVGTVIALLS